jgi:hypothetical protein
VQAHSEGGHLGTIMSPQALAFPCSSMRRGCCYCCSNFLGRSFDRSLDAEIEIELR